MRRCRSSHSGAASNVIAMSLVTESKQTNAVALHPNVIFSLWCVCTTAFQRPELAFLLAGWD